MKRRQPGLASLLEGALAKLPPWPGSLLFATGLNLTLAPHLPADVRAALEGKAVRIQVRDLGIRFELAWRATRFVPLLDVAVPVLAIEASARDFVLLAQRREDPDTLFFSRRLCMEGDTELGLMVKNTLDAIDFRLFPSS